MNVYFDPRHPAGFSGAATLQSYVKGDAKTWLRGQEAYTLHAPARKRFERNYYKVSKMDDLWQADLCDMRDLAKDNDGYKYLLTVIDVLSKYAWVEPLKDKSAATVRQAFEHVFSERKPDHLQTDKGKEFISATTRQFFKRHDVNFFTTQNPDVKAAVAERFNRTLKTYMWRYFTHHQTRRYIDVLADLVYAYNHRKHSSILMAPADVTPETTRRAFSNLYRHRDNTKQEPKLHVGDHVRISREKSVFEKGYEKNWSREIFKIVKVLRRDKVVYELVDLADEPVVGTFYQLELQKVSLPDAYKIQQVLRTKGKGDKRMLLVKWAGYPDKFNSWISERDLT